jgi:hypothetical protein
LRPGRGWAPVGSWARLAEAAREAAAGASVVVLASFPGNRKGHAVLGHVTAGGGLRWVDPADGKVSEGEDLPESLKGIVAAWAVVVGPDGRVAEPGDWAFESTGVVSALVDAPRRHDVAAMGGEDERHGYILYLPGGVPVPAKTVLLQSPDGLVKIVSDNGSVWLGQDDAFYESLNAMWAAGVAPAETGSHYPGELGLSVPETVSVPWAVLEGEHGRRPDRAAVHARVRQVRRRLARAPRTRTRVMSGVELTHLFPDYRIMNELACDVRVIQLAGLFEGAPLLAHLSLGVPLGGGVLAVLKDLVRSNEPSSPVARPLRAAVRFGWQVATLYLKDATRAVVAVNDIPALALDWNVAAVSEVMALAFVQLEAILDYEAADTGIIKGRMAVVPRQSLYELWRALGEVLQGFFGRRAEDIAGLFVMAFLDLDPRYALRYNAQRGLPPQTEIDLLEVGRCDGGPSVGELFDEILRPAHNGRRIDPSEAFGIGPADTGGLDRTRDNVPGMPHSQVVLELRSFSRSKFDPAQRPGTAGLIDAEMLDQNIARLTDVARDGDAAAALAGRLGTRPEGQQVLYWLRTALGAPPGSDQERAVAFLLMAIRSYLRQYPEDETALERALQPAADHLAVPSLTTTY